MLPQRPRRKLFLGSSGRRRFDGSGSVGLEAAFPIEEIVLIVATVLAAGKEGIRFGHRG